MARLAFACVVAFPLVCCLFLYGVATFLTLQITQPVWYRPHVHQEDSPFPLLDHHFVEMFESQRTAYAQVTSPSVDHSVGYEQIEIETTEMWMNPRTKKEEIMKLRGWYIGWHMEFNGTTNKDRIISELRYQNVPEEEITKRFSGKKEGMIGVHGGGVDRRELLRHIPLWMSSGYEILLVDCRDHGLSDGKLRGLSFGLREHVDISNIADYATGALQWDNIVIFGSSQGGASSLLGYHHTKQKEYINTTPPPISCMVIENAYSQKVSLWKSAIHKVLRGERFGRSKKQTPGVEFVQKWVGEYFPEWLLDPIIEITLYQIGFSLNRLDPIDVAEELNNVKLLFLHGSDDSVVDVTHSVLLHEQTSTKEKELKVFEGGTHAILSFQFPEEYATTVQRFLVSCHN